MTAAHQALSGLRIVDLSRWVAGEYATKMFADFGADVVKVERPGVGSLTRGWGPFRDDAVDREASALFLHLNTNKRSIVIDLATTAGRESLLDLVATADAVIESFRPGQLERLRLSPDELFAVNPRLVLTRISAFGQTGPYRDYEATGLVLQAMGGPMHATGDAQREPLRKPGVMEQYTIGRTAAEATLAGLRNAEVNSRGCVVDVSGQEVLLSSADRRASYLLSASYSGIDAPRGTRSAHRGRTTFTGPFRAKDGYVMVYVTNQSFWNRFVNLVGAEAPEFRAQFLDRTDVATDRHEFIAFVTDWFARRPKQQIMEEGMAARIPLTAVLEIDELLDHPHFRARAAFASVQHPVAGRLVYPGAPWRMAGGFALRSAAPLLDEHGDALRTELAARRHATKPAAAPRTQPLVAPLEGIRVVDLTVVWAGPGATALLGDLGAEVIRIEANNRMSRQVSAALTKEIAATLGYHAATYPDRDPGPRPYDRSALFNWHARNKLSACMNLDSPEGRRAARELIAISDVFVENNSNGTMEKLGLGHAELLELNPRLIVARMPPMGMSGPMSDYLGYGPNFNSLVGIAAMDGYEGETPDTAGENYHMDEATPAGLAFAVLAALRRRESTGSGGLIEFAQSENVIHDIGEYLLAQQLTGRNPAVLGNSDPHLRQGVYPAAGDDRWVAISLRTDAESDRLSALMAADGCHRIADWTRSRKASELVEYLQSAGIPAGEVLSEGQVLDDPHLAAREWFQVHSHPAVGTHRYPGHPWRAQGMALRFGRALPGFGADNAYVYKTLLQYDDETYDDLVRRGLVTEEQFA
jgi:benzylsuccinate CoA-transferase BbsF subunit/naphthyl-2-methylsuccinate CoA transferase subunit